MADEPKYKRVLLKLSGEALAGEKKIGLDYSTITPICESIKKCADAGVQIGIVVGGGNFWRGRSSGAMDRTRADHIGMLATTMNALAVADVLESLGVDVRVQTAIAMHQVAEPYIRNKAVRHLEKGRVVIFGAGTGNPYFTTDTTAALRSAEIEADIMLMAKKQTDGVYDADPKFHPEAKMFTHLTYSEVLQKELAVMDNTAITLCMNNEIPIKVFNIDVPGNIVKACKGDTLGTLIEGK